MRKLLESAKKDAESEAKALQERFEMESKTTGRSLIDLQEKMGKAAEDISEWEKRHAALGVAMSEQVLCAYVYVCVQRVYCVCRVL